MKAELTAEGGVDKATYPAIRFLLRYVCPVLVSVVFVFGIASFIQSLGTPAEVETVEAETPEFKLEVMGDTDTEAIAEDAIERVELTVVETNNN